MEDLLKVLDKNHLTLSTVESLTGGLFASEFTKVAGASAVFLGSLVSYANSVKSNVLNIDKEVINKFGVVSSEVSELMAKCGQNLFQTDVCLAFTGNAGPGVLEDKEVGLVYSTIVIKDKIYNYCDKLSGERNEVRNTIVNLVKSRLIILIEGKGGL